MFDWLLLPGDRATRGHRKPRPPYDPELDRKVAAERMRELRRSLPFRGRF